MERESRTDTVLAAVRRLGSHPLVWIAIAVFVAWRGYAAYAPQVTRVERDAEGRLIISGRNFGTTRGDSALVYNFSDSEIEIEVNEWSNDRIIAQLRGEVASGSVSVKRAFWFLHWPSSEAALVIAEEGLPSKPFGYEVPVQAGSPWPLFRRNRRNAGQSPLPAAYGGDAPWSFPTGKGVAASPVIDEQGVAYVGSADHSFYAVASDGSERWRYRTGGIIDSAAALLRPDAAGGPPTVVVGSGDGFLYRLRTGNDVRGAAAREVFAFDARVSPRGTDSNWFEGSVAVGYDGTVYAGNTNSSYYAVRPNGELKWTYETGGNNRSMAALGLDGTIFWGSGDTFVHAVNPNGTAKWSKRTWGMVSASAALGSDGTVYISSFDSYLYALDAETGDVRWTFKADDHICGSAGLGQDANGTTDAIYFGSTDGRLYALSPQGEQLWAYDTGDPIRSSPAIGLGPKGEHPGIVYFGSGNGQLYALNSIDGQRRWSFDTTPSEPEVYDRNDLNSSVALGRNGVYVGSESGRLWYVPYDYCLHAADARCSTAPGEDLPKELARLLYVSPGGTTHFEETPLISPATVITLRLVVRNRVRTVDAHLCNTPLLCSVSDIDIETEPHFDFRAEQSADGRYLHIIPDKILQAGTSYRIRLEGDYYTGGFHFGNLTVGGSRGGHFKDGLTLRTRAAAGPSPLLGKRDEAPAFEWTRLAVPIPTMLASLNQIALDDMELILGAVDVRPSTKSGGRLIVWGIGGQRDDKGALVADPDSAVTLALTGTYAAESFALTGRSFTAKVEGVPIPFDRLEIRGQLEPSLAVQPGATLFAEADALAIPTLGPYLVAAGLANRIYDKLVIAGTYITRPYSRTAPANKRPRGLQVSFVEYVQPTERLPGQVVAHFRLARGAHYKLAEHRVGIILIDRLSGEVVPLDYASQISASANPQGEVSQVVLTIPAELPLSDELEVIVVADVFPLHRERLEKRAQAK